LVLLEASEDEVEVRMLYQYTSVYSQPTFGLQPLHKISSIVRIRARRWKLSEATCLDVIVVILAEITIAANVITLPKENGFEKGA
jgi:hypothetical protein